MIKITEEPVTYSTSRNDPTIIETWIYKNPTEDEVDDIKNISQSIRILIKDNDYYITAGYYMNHNTMADYLYYYNHVKYADYDAYFEVYTDDNEMVTGWSSSHNVIKSYGILKPFISDMVHVGVMDYNTRIGEHAMDGYGVNTVEDLLNINLDKVK